MGQGIRRTALMQARTEDPFEALMKTDAQRMARNQQSEESLLARDAKRGMFDEEMEMRGSQFDRKFAETQMQNAAARSNAAARLGLARQAAARAAKGSSAPSWYEKQRQLHQWGLEDIDAQGKYKSKDKKGGIFNQKEVDAFATEKDLDAGQRKQLVSHVDAAKRAGLNPYQIEDSVYGATVPNDLTSWIPFRDDNEFNMRKAESFLR